MKLKYWTDFSKRKNSTKQPLDTQAVEIDIKLKDDCSIINPVIQSSSIPINANYFYIADYGRYYYLDNTERTSNQLKDISTEVDVLATYKSYIGACNAMVVRSSSNYNKMLRDELVHVSTEKTIVRTVGSSVGFAKWPGCYLLSVINEDGGVNSFACQYIISSTGLTNIAQQLMNSSFIDDIKKYFSNINNAIVSLKWLPMDYTAVTSQCTTSTALKFANTEITGYSAHRISNTSIYVDGSQSITIPWDSNQDFTECAPYTTMKLLVPMYGLVDLNAADFVSASSVVMDYRYDITTGDVIMIISAGSSGAILQTLQFNVAVDVPVASLTKEVGSIMSSTSGLAGSAVAFAASAVTNNVPGMAASGLAAITSAASLGLNMNGSSVSVKGAINGKAAMAYGDKPQLMLYIMKHADPTRAAHVAAVGRPVQACDTISNFSGYVQCSDASVSMPGTAVEKDRVNSYLNSGFFYE